MLLPTATGPFSSVVLVEAGHPDRQAVEAFIANVYRLRFGARLHTFMPNLLAFHDHHGRLAAAVGWRDGSEGALFLEQYLDLPADQLLAQRTGRGVVRAELAEVGNLAALDAGASRALIAYTTRVLHAQGMRWVLFTATRQLRNAFRHLRLEPCDLAPARVERLGEAAADWGSYYSTQPHVVYGDVAAGHAFLCRQDAAVHAEPARALPVELCLQAAT